MSRAGTWVLAAVGLILAAPTARAAGEAELVGELTLRAASAAGDVAALEALWRDRSVPGAVRGRALWAQVRGARGPLAPEVRELLVAALDDAAPEVRRAGARAVGRAGERVLEGRVLTLAAEDPDPRVRVEALEAVRPWTRPGHRYALGQALGTPWPEVHAQVLRNLARLSPRELVPEFLARARSLAEATNPPEVRTRALEALGTWGQVTEEEVRSALADPASPVLLRLEALRWSDTGPAVAGRDGVLLDWIRDGSSPRLAWEAFRRLRTVADPAVAPAVARHLGDTPVENAATAAMAGFLREKGYRVEFRAGAWRVSAR